MIKLILILLMLFGCSEYHPNFASSLEGWVGNTPMELTEQWGLPDNQAAIDAETQVYTYNFHASNGMQNPYPTQFVYSAVDSVDLPPEPDLTSQYYCQVSFIINNGIISSYNFNGDDCREDILPQN